MIPITYFKAQENQVFGSLYVPSQQVFNALSYIEGKFEQVFTKIFYMPKVMERLIKTFYHKYRPYDLSRMPQYSRFGSGSLLWN